MLSPYISNTGYQGILRILSYFFKGVNQVGPLHPRNVRMPRYFCKGVYQLPFLGIIPGMARYPKNPKLFFHGGLPGRCHFLRSCREWQGILRIPSYFSKGVYQVGALSCVHPGNGKVSLEFQVTLPRGFTR